ncbi:MAG: carbamoyltransferase HypF [Bacteroidetes bacterium]|nr:carbamoyltransferase HypF [Bacteroidota bacterium]
MKKDSLKHVTVRINGLVQGVGFRPFVYRSAQKNNISGWVKNRSEGILIEATGKMMNIDNFISDLKSKAPVAAQIENVLILPSDQAHKNGFQIILSDEYSGEKEITQIGPDIAVCANCLEDIRKQPHRLNYPFTNCTNCGPRFSIIRDLPYDRNKTTMDVFEMCPTCASEYENPTNRRFHAQPVACLNCGPNYMFISQNIKTENFEEVLEHTARYLTEGKIVAVKGIGGFFIACDALQEYSVQQLRKIKIREGKPFAIMFRDVETVTQYCAANQKEIDTLDSWRRPIVILRSKNLLPESVSNGINTIGALLPYMPFHYLLFEKLKTSAIVFTSGNLKDEPIIIENKDAEKKLGSICDAIVIYNRVIYNRSDDSVLQVVSNKPRIMRRSKGWVPNPVNLRFNSDGILATGAELKNTFCLGKGNQAILSQHIGDLKDFETYSFYEKSIVQFQKMFRVKPEIVVHDLHPDYLSTKYALNSGISTFSVQHHHAHIASCMAEFGLDEKVIGVSFDGTGLGDDGNIWGSEFMVCDLDRYQRVTHFEYIPMPGGDLAAKEPWRMAVSWLYKVFGRDFLHLNLPFLEKIPDEKIEWVFNAVNGNINCPLTSSCGRLFDAVSALLNLCTHSTFEAEAPMRLENIAAKNENGKYTYKQAGVIVFSEMFSEIVRDLQQKTGPETISAKFHNTISSIITEGVKKMGKNTGLNKVVLSGGTFQNQYLLERTENKLLECGLNVFSNCSVPCNDGGISLGQLVIVAKRRNLNKISINLMSGEL